MANEGYPAGGGGVGLSAAQMLLRLTGAATLAAGSMLFGAGTSTLSTLSIGASGTFLKSNGSAPAWANIAATDITSGTLSAARGGTGVSNAGTLTNANNTTITGGGTLALGGFALTVPATGTAALLGAANAFAGNNTFAGTSAFDGAPTARNSTQPEWFLEATGSSKQWSVRYRAGSSQLSFTEIGVAEWLTITNGTGAVAFGGTLAAGATTITGALTVNSGGASSFTAAASATTGALNVYPNAGASGDRSFVVWDDSPGVAPRFYVRRGGGIFSDGRAVIQHGTITSAASSLDTSVTWNSGATAFTGWKLNATDTASAAGSLLLDLQIGGSSRANITKAGLLNLANGITAGGNISISSASAAIFTATNVGTQANISADDGSSTVTVNAYKATGATLAMTVANSGGSNITRLSINNAGLHTFTGSALIAQGSITAAAPNLDATTTWNSGGVTFTGWRLNITDTASAAASLLLNLQVGGSSKATIGKSGALTLTGGTVTTSTPLLNLTQTWNAGGVVFQALSLNVTDTASNASSTLISLQVGAADRFYVRGAGDAGHFLSTASTTGTFYAITNALTSTGTPAAGFGTGLQFALKSSTTSNQVTLNLVTEWVVATHASRTSRTTFAVFDTASREALRLEASGSAAMIGFLGAAAVVRATMAAATGTATRTTFDTTTVTVAQLAERVKALIDDFRTYGLHG